MNTLGFFKPVYSTDKNFSAVSFFDNYFSFSGRKYQVISPCTVGNVQGHKVELKEVKKSITLNVLKAISYGTILIPIIMGVGKIIMRSRHKFFVENGTTGPATASQIDKKTTPKPKVVKASELDKDKYKLEIQQFKNKCLNTLGQAAVATKPLDFTLTQEQRNLIERVNKNKYSRTQEKGVSIVRGGGHFVFFLSSIPGFVFKPMSEEEADRYVATSGNARKEIRERNLYLLHAPESRIIEINGEYFIMQERADLNTGNYRGQKGIYSCCWEDKEMHTYMHTLFSQLLEFIAVTDFADVKYDNIPLTQEGKVALIDLDQSYALTGLTRGCASKGGGLLNYIPEQFLNEYFDKAKNYLSPEMYRVLQERRVEILSKVKRSHQNQVQYAEFCKSNAIATPTQALKTDLPKIFEDRKKQELALYIIEKLNEQLEKSNNFSIKKGRSCILLANIGDDLTNKIESIWGKIPFLDFKGGNDSRQSVIVDVLEGLKASNYIYNYKTSFEYYFVKVNC